jgi:hypothetical protein
VKLFIKRLATVKITGVSLHSYRYAWVERAKQGVCAPAAPDCHHGRSDLSAK